MSEEKVLKPKSFRINDETAEAFKKISIEIGGNQQEALSKLIEAYEFQRGKAVLTEKKADIEKFEKHATVLTRMYMDCLEDNQNITEIVRSEFEAQLQSKDQIIQDLQSQLATTKQLKEQSTAKAKGFADENARLNAYIKSLEEEFNSKTDDMQSMLTDKESLNKVLTDTCNSLKAKVTELEKETAEISNMRSNIADLTSERNKLASSKNELENSLKSLNAVYEKEIADLKKHEADALEHCREQLTLEQKKKILKLQQEYHEQIQQIKEKKQDEIDKYQKIYFELLKKIELQRNSERNNIEKSNNEELNHTKEE